MLDKVYLAVTRLSFTAPTGGSRSAAGQRVDTKLNDLIADIRQWSLLACILAIIIAAVIWAWGSQSQNAAQATQGKKGVLVAIGAAAVIVAAGALVEWGASFGDAI